MERISCQRISKETTSARISSVLCRRDPHPQDWVAIYEADTDLNNPGGYLQWLYTCGNQHCQYSASSGTLTFGSDLPNESSRADFPLPAGDYIANLVRGYTLSADFIIRNTSCQQTRNTIIDVLEGRGNFQTLLAALEATGLDEALNSPGPDQCTLFAPNDDAFALLEDGVLDYLLANLQPHLSMIVLRALIYELR
jgi:hypothetical protein